MNVASVTASGADDASTAAGVEGLGHLEGPAEAVPNIAFLCAQSATTTAITPTVYYTTTTSRTIAGTVPAGAIARWRAKVLLVAGNWRDAYDLSIAAFSVCGIGR